MTPLIHIVIQNEIVLKNIKLLLKFQKFNVITSKNGKEAISLLTSLGYNPDLIISEIILPEMDGYEFYSKISENQLWANIPVIFLSSQGTPEDGWFGKKLGNEDYLTIPYESEALLAKIKVKIDQNKKSQRMKQQIEDKLVSSFNIDFKPSLVEEEKEQVFLLYVLWDEGYGPKLVKVYPTEQLHTFDLQQVGIQLFQASTTLYGYSGRLEAQGVLLRISNINKDGYIYFDTFEDTQVRGGERQFMLSLLAPKINYLESLRIKDLFTKIAAEIKKGNTWSEELSWKTVSEILMQPIITKQKKRTEDKDAKEKLEESGLW